MIRQFACALVVSIVSVTTCFAFAQKKQDPQQPLSSARAAAPISPQEGEPISGKVVQSMNSGGYSYVLLQKKGGEQMWLAMPQTTVPQGKEMTFRPGMEMANFESKTLKRTFDRIIFSEGPVASAGIAKGEEKSPGSKGAVAKTAGKIKVAKAAGPDGYTIADVYRLKKKLDRKKVAVRGQVVKVSAGIMNRNWIHIQDGSGSAGKRTNNLVVTSQALPLVGDVVTATGIIYKDKDFGGGYKYEAIMEKGELSGK